MAMDIASISQKIYSQISRAENILLVAHQQPDADALGSLVAFGNWLDFLGKKHTKFCRQLASPSPRRSGQPPAPLDWLSGFQPLITDWAELASDRFDLLVILDSGDLKYAGFDQIFFGLPYRPIIINIDHHATNRHFGDINLVDSEAVATTEIIFKLFKNLNVPISRQTASALLAGIIYDTYNFTNPNTTYQSFSIASRLLLDGASLPQVSDSIIKTKTVSTLQTWGKALVRLNYNSFLAVATTTIIDEDLPEDGEQAEAAEGMANFLNNLSDIKAVLILQQQPDGYIKGSLRTNDDSVDVARLAKVLGGGGHRKAAGFRVKGELVKTAEGHWQII